MITPIEFPNKYWKSQRRRKVEMWNLASLVLFIFLISTSEAIKCYVCGPSAELPFLESKSTRYNETFIKQKIHQNCDEFDRIPLEEKFKYEMECPKESLGCMLNVGQESITRTCSDLPIDDCKTANNNHFCYCNRELCNGMNAESLMENLNQDNEDDLEPGSDDVGSGSDEEGDDDDDFYPSTSRKIEFTETSTTEGNKFAILSVSPATSEPTINKAVNSHLARNLLIFLFVVRFFIVSFQI